RGGGVDRLVVAVVVASGGEQHDGHQHDGGQQGADHPREGGPALGRLLGRRRWDLTSGATTGAGRGGRRDDHRLVVDPGGLVAARDGRRAGGRGGVAQLRAPALAGATSRRRLARMSRRPPAAMAVTATWAIGMLDDEPVRGSGWPEVGAVVGGATWADAT